MKVTLNIPEKTVKKAMALLVISDDIASEHTNEVVETDSIELSLRDAFAEVMTIAELKQLELAFAVSACQTIIKQKQDSDEQDNTDWKRL